MIDGFAMEPYPDGADIEIFERRNGTTEGANVVTPNEIRINGVGVLMPAGRAIVIDPIDFDHPAAIVTVTMYASRVRIHQHPENDVVTKDEPS
ncbi:hypothetical protein [Streptodolium elevatio]|uniref:Uncharacterized protein n=1 Tax=Streptodolium elevatio TaxID=3157996 RepID=A0ABV3DK13_9ACTN